MLKLCLIVLSLKYDALGKRLLKDWLTSPLCRIPDIVDRQKAIQELAYFRKENDKEYESVIQTLKSLPDFERLLSKCVAQKTKQIHFNSFI